MVASKKTLKIVVVDYFFVEKILKKLLTTIAGKFNAETDMVTSK